MTPSSILFRILRRWPIKIVCVSLAVVLYILFKVNTLTERQISVPLEVLTPEGFIVSSEYPRSINVTLRGEDDEIKDILSDDIAAFANLARFTEEGEYQVPVELRKTGSALAPEALGLRPRPRDIAFAVERRTVRSLEVKPEITGFPALGYELAQYFVSPSSVTAVGPQSQMTELVELTTELIDLSGRRSDFTVTTRIIPPSAQIEIPGGQIVEFRGVIDEAVVIRTITDQEVVVFDLPEGLSIEGELPRVSLTVQGSQLSLEGVRPGDMTFYIDGSRITEPGNYRLTLATDIPPSLAVLSLAPREVDIRVIQIEREADENSRGPS